jgi:hypothetical protein
MNLFKKTEKHYLKYNEEETMVEQDKAAWETEETLVMIKTDKRMLQMVAVYKEMTE